MNILQFSKTPSFPLDGRFVVAMSGWSMSLDIIRFLSYIFVDSGFVHNVQFYFLFLWWKVTRSNGHRMVNLWLNLDFCYVSGIKRGSLEFLGGFFQAEQFGFDFRFHIWYKCISCCVASMKSMSYHCLQAFARKNANRTTGNSEKRQTYS